MSLYILLSLSLHVLSIKQTNPAIIDCADLSVQVAI